MGNYVCVADLAQGLTVLSSQPPCNKVLLFRTSRVFNDVQRLNPPYKIELHRLFSGVQDWLRFISVERCCTEKLRRDTGKRTASVNVNAAVESACIGRQRNRTGEDIDAEVWLPQQRIGDVFQNPHLHGIPS